MNRRRFIAAGAMAILGAPLAAEAQRFGQLPRIGFLSNSAPTTTASPEREAFRRGLRELGWIEGQTVTIEYRWAEGNVDRISALAGELVQLKVDVIVLAGPLAIRAAQRATNTIPIVFVSLVDPVAAGFVASLAHPGGHMTGLASQYEELITKQVQLLREAVPKASRIALLQHRESLPAILSAAETAARSLGLTARTLKVGEVAEFENAFRLALSARGSLRQAFRLSFSPSWPLSIQAGPSPTRMPSPTAPRTRFSRLLSR